MTLDELLLEWSYKSEKGYPSLGNPSDIYGGFGLGFPISNWSAEVFLDQNFLQPF